MNKENGHSALIAITDKGGRPTKYEPETVDRLLAALADRLTQKQAYIASGAPTRSWPRGGRGADRRAGTAAQSRPAGPRRGWWDLTGLKAVKKQMGRSVWAYWDHRGGRRTGEVRGRNRRAFLGGVG